MFKKRVGIGEVIITKAQKNMVQKVLKSNRMTEGQYTKKFEEEFAKFIGTKYAIACSNGTAALMLIFWARSLQNEELKLGAVKAVVPATTFPATLNSVILTGNNFRLCDINNEYLIDTKDAEEKIIKYSLNTIVPVHLMGNPCDMDSIKKLKSKYDLFVVEDCCESPATKYKGKRVGSFGDAAAFSFYGSHPAGVGELGVITTNDETLAKLIKSIKNHGRTGNNLEFKHKYIGYNMKTVEFMSAMALVEIKNLDKIMKKRYEIAKYYYENINHENLVLSIPKPTSNYLGYAISVKTRLPHPFSSEHKTLWDLHTAMEDKKRFTSALNNIGIETRDMFPCLKNQEAYKFLKIDDVVSLSNEKEATSFYIPCHQYVTKKAMKDIVRALNNVKIGTKIIAG